MREKFNYKTQKEFRQKLRKSATIPEKILWTKLRGRQLKGRKFRRQAGIGKYVVDFYCPAEKLIVELDGAYHKSATMRIQDQKRDSYFEDIGLRVLRIPNFTGTMELEVTLKLIASQFDS